MTHRAHTIGGEAMPAANLTRRLAIMGGLTIAALSATDNLSTASGQPDAELIRLGKELERELARENHLAAMVHSAPQDQRAALSDGDDFNDCHVRLTSLVAAIDALPASTLAGFAAKAHALLYDLFLWESMWGEDEDYSIKALRGFVAELRKAGGAS